MNPSWFDSGHRSIICPKDSWIKNLQTGISMPVCMLALLLCFAGISVGAQEAASKNVSVATVDTKIAPGFVLNVAIEGEEELSHEYNVDAKGNLHFKITDSKGENVEEWDVPVKGKTTVEARDALAASLDTYLREPRVHLTIARMPGLRVEISGEVVHPAAINMPLNSRLSDLLAVAFTKPMADLSKIIIRRPDPEAKTTAGVRTFNVDFSVGTNGDDNDDPKLQDGDKVYVWKLAEAPVPIELQVVRIVGEIKADVRDVVNGTVQREDGVAIPLSKNMTVKDAFARIGGLKDSADRNHIYLGRMDGRTTILDADRVEADDPNHNLLLKPGDLIIVGKRDRSQIFAVLGEVNTPNTFELPQGKKIRLLDAIARGGDLSKKADKHKGILSKGYLLDPAKARAIPFDPELVKNGKQPNMDIEAGDAVFIDQRKKRPTFWQQILPLALHFLPF